MDERLHLNWTMARLMKERGYRAIDVSRMAKVHAWIVGQMQRNAASRASLDVLARLARALGVGIAPPPPRDSSDGTRDGAAPPLLLRWERDEDGNDVLTWNLRELRERHGESIRDLFFMVGRERTTLQRMDKATAKQAALDSIGAVAWHYGAGLGEAPGNQPATDYLLEWGPPRQAVEKAEDDESPIPGEPSKVCRCKLCRSINPDGIEKRISAFPRNARYAYGVGPVCKAGRRAAEKERRRAKKAEAEKAANESAGT